MGVYIKGMEMPKVAGRIEAVITILKDGTAQIAISPAEDQIGYWKEYPLSEIPPHGRLIDADALTGRILEEHDKFGAMNQYDSGLRAGYRASTKAVRLAPTIIPADPAEEDE